MAHRKDVNTYLKGVSMQHRHFSFIAGVIRDIEDQDMHRAMMNHFADALKSTNPKFDRARFIAACVRQ